MTEKTPLNPASAAPRRRVSGLIVAVGVAAGVWALGRSGILQPLAGLFYDPIVRLQQRVDQGRASVLLVEIEPSGPPPGEADLTKLLDALQGLKARRVAFNFLPHQVSADFYRKAASSGNVVFGRSLVPDPNDPESLRPAPLPAAAEGLNLATGAVGPPPAAYGVSRRQLAVHRVGGGLLPALEAAAADPGAVPSGEADYLVNFRGGPGSLPILSLVQALGGGLVSDLVGGRTVLVGYGTPPALPGLHTPTTDDAHPMSLLEYQGHALDTLLSGRGIRRPGDGAVLAGLLIAAALSLLAYQWLDVRWSSWITAGLVILYVASAAFAYLSARLWLPLAEAILSQLLLFVLVLTNRVVYAQQAFQKLLLDLTSKMRERFSPTSFYGSQEHWSQVITMVDQTLDLRRLIFLERVPRDHRVREIKSLNCSISDISEVRRDYERTPYSTAIAARGPIRLEKKYLKAIEGDEHQYLVPLIFGGEVLGFWAFGVDPARAAAIPNFEGIVRDYGEQIGEMLYHRQRVLSEASARGRWRRFLTSERQSEVQEALSKTMGLMERRLARTEGLLDEMHSATIVYDLFGRTVKVNARMQDLLKKAGFPPYERTALDLVTTLTGSDAAPCRRFLRHAIIDRGALSLPVKLAGDHRSYILNVRPLQLAGGQQSPDEPAPFHVQGIVCELIDRTSLTRLVEKMGDLTQRLGVHLRNQLSSIELAASLLGMERVPDDKRKTLSTNISDKIKEAVATLAQCQQYLGMDAPMGEVECFPVDSQTPLRAAVDAHKPLADGRGLTVEVRQPNLMSHVFASPVNLQHVFGHILASVLRDAVEKSRVEVKVEEGEKWVTYSFSNTGFGIPADRFRGYLTDETEPASEDFKNLRNAVRWVKAWGGSLEADSEVGVGTRATLKLERFI